MISVSVPATSANLCVGFDSLGLAVDFTGKFGFSKSDSLVITGCPEEYCNEDNLVVQAFKKTCEYLNKEMPAFHLHIDCDIPFARGLGSSSACVAAGIAAADAWFDAGMNKMEMLDVATAIEGHPDNAAPAIFGKACCCFMEDDKPAAMVIPAADWKLLAMIPDYPVSTNEARKLLPKEVSFHDAAAQVGRALVFSQALQTGNEMRLFEACQDVLHEPYRKTLISQYPALHEYCHEHKIAFWISGSGSTMMAASLDNAKLAGLKEFAMTLKPAMALKDLEIAKKGAEAVHV